MDRPFAPEIAGGGMGLGGYADDELPPTRGGMDARKGVAFQTDLGAVGGQAKGAFGAPAKNIEAEERKLIDKVFNLVDRDGSGHIDITELTGMFSIFGIESQFISSAITRVMSVVDKDRDNMITPAEFYAILSQRFEKGDARDDIDAVFNKMNKARDNQLSVKELLEVSTMLGNADTKAEIEDMIKVFSQNYNAEMRDFNSKKVKPKNDLGQPLEPRAPTFLTADDFYVVMQDEFKIFGAGLRDIMEQQP